MMRFLLDSNAIIYILNQGLKLQAEHDYFISIITEIELLSFSRLTQEEVLEIKKVLSQFNQINLTERIKDKTIFIRRTNKIKLPDCIIIATALEKEATLITHDQQLINSGLVDCQLLDAIL